MLSSNLMWCIDQTNRVSTHYLVQVVGQNSCLGSQLLQAYETSLPIMVTINPSLAVMGGFVVTFKTLLNAVIKFLNFHVTRDCHLASVCTRSKFFTATGCLRWRSLILEVEKWFAVCQLVF